MTQLRKRKEYYEDSQTDSQTDKLIWVGLGNLRFLQVNSGLSATPSATILNHKATAKTREKYLSLSIEHGQLGLSLALPPHWVPVHSYKPYVV